MRGKCLIPQIDDMAQISFVQLKIVLNVLRFKPALKKFFANISFQGQNKTHIVRKANV